MPRRLSANRLLHARPPSLQVHAYVHSAGGRTAYLSELKSGAETVVVDAQGRQRTAVVGRIKVESRPLVRLGCVVPDRAVRAGTGQGRRGGRHRNACT